MKENFNKATWFSYNRLETTTSTNLFHHLHLTTSLKSLKRLHVYPKLLLWATTFFIFMQIYTTTDSVKIFYFWMNNIFIKQYILTSKLLLIRISKLPYSVTRFFSFIFKNAYANWLFFFRIILFSIFLSQMLAEESNDICKIFLYLFVLLFILWLYKIILYDRLIFYKLNQINFPNQSHHNNFWILLFKCLYLTSVIGVLPLFPCWFLSWDCPHMSFVFSLCSVFLVMVATKSRWMLSLLDVSRNVQKILVF